MAMGPTLSEKESEDMREDEYHKNGRVGIEGLSQVGVAFNRLLL